MDAAPLNNSPSVEDGPREPLTSSGNDLAAVIDRGFSGENHTDPGQQGSLLLFVAVTCCCVSPILFGYTIGVTSPAQVTMEGDCLPAPAGNHTCADASGVQYPPTDLVVFDKDGFAWYAGLLNIGAVIGAFSGSFFSERWGRKKTLVFTAVPHAIGWFGSAFCSNGILLTLLRMLLGVGVGIGSAVTPCYIGEVATNDLRGALGAANQLSVTFGIFLVNAFGTYVFEEPVADQNFVQWRHLMILAGVLTAVLVTILFLPESPKWLAANGQKEEAKNALTKLRNGDSSVELNDILTEASQQAASGSGAGAGAAAEASLSDYKPSMIIAIGLCMFQQLGGVNAVMFYAGNICKQAGIQNANGAAMILMGAQVILTGISCLLMERAGRRSLLMFGAVSMTFGHLCLAYYFQEEDTAPSWLAMGGLGIFVVGFSFALGPIPWLIMAEVFPTDVRSRASSIACAVNWGCSFIVCVGFSKLEDALTKQGAFFMFALVCAACFVFVVSLVPETKGKSVEEVLKALNTRSATTRHPSTSLDSRAVSLQEQRARASNATAVSDARPSETGIASGS